MEKMELRIGPPAAGASYFKRPDVEGELRDAMTRGHVSFMAPRRTGKTSMLMHLVADAPVDQPHWLINLETCTTPRQWLESLMKPLHSKDSRWGAFKKATANGFKRIEGLKLNTLGEIQLTQADWRRPADEFFRLLMKQTTPVTFLLDEFPVLVDELAKADEGECRQMLRWFRDWRQKTVDTQIRFLVTGSIGLDNVVKRHGMWDTVNDFDSIELPPLERADATRLVMRLSKDNGVEMTEDLALHALDLIGPAWPFFLQILVAELKRSGGGITKESLEGVYNDRLVGGVRDKYAKNMWDRLRKVFEPQERSLAKVLLDSISRSSGGLSRSQMKAAARVHMTTSYDEEQLNVVLEILKHDGYLTQDLNGEQKTVFFSNLLRDCWVRLNS